MTAQCVVNRAVLLWLFSGYMQLCGKDNVFAEGLYCLADYTLVVSDIFRTIQL